MGLEAEIGLKAEESLSSAAGTAQGKGDFSVLLHHHPAKVAILLCTYCGESFLPDQLASFERQTYKNWTLYVSDDGSTDHTLDILGKYQVKWGQEKINLYTGPKKGSTANFLFLTCDVELDAAYYAYSDQDDIWDEDKLSRAITWLNKVSHEIPAVYCTRTRLVDKNNQDIGYSPLFLKPPGFKNALVQSIAGGNTMVFNQAALRLLKKAGVDGVVAHDWWVYLLVTACGGEVRYDSNSSLRYRQHEANLIGMNLGWNARLTRLNMLWQGNFKKWNDLNIVALERMRPYMTLENQEILDRFIKIRKKFLFARIWGVWRLGIYRQTILDNLGLIVAILFKKI